MGRRMKISRLIYELKRVQREHGDLEVTCTGTFDRERENPAVEGGPYETTVENLNIQEPSEKWDEPRVRLYQ